MCDKTILENDGTLKPVANCYKNQEICNEAVDNCLHALEFVSECYKTQKLCDKTIDTHSSTIQFVIECYKTQQMFDEAFNKCFFLYLFIFLFGLKLKKCVAELFLKILFG